VIYGHMASQSLYLRCYRKHSAGRLLEMSLALRVHTMISSPVNFGLRELRLRLLMKEGERRGAGLSFIIAGAARIQARTCFAVASSSSNIEILDESFLATYGDRVLGFVLLRNPHLERFQVWTTPHTTSILRLCKGAGTRASHYKLHENF
jgi:hypothetical protein